ncbi:uncharacterized protein [Triticum aestivum]|uniref:uncharacterized protein n=1 Tax=Triticum aestivum TaxID=4565 RepID=UPI001D027EA7|nr:uncharacterized protein LOC123122312 [Triticum aestivum]
MCLPALARVPLQSAMSTTCIFSSCHLMIMSLAAVLQGMRLSCRSVIEDTVYGRADGVSMADEGCEDESQVQSRSSTVEEVGTYDPENQSYAGGDNWSKTGSYSELRTKVADGSISGVDGGRRAAKRARVED